MDYYEILHLEKYFTISELRYSINAGYQLSSAQDVKDFLDYKDNYVETGIDKPIKPVALALKSFNSNHIFYMEHPELISLYGEYITLINSESVFSDNRFEMKRARVYSEVEGSLNIEGFNSTRALFDSIVDGKTPENENEIVIRNMAAAINFVDTVPAFNAENFSILYSLLSKDSLNENQKLKPEEKYRHDLVYISTYSGAPVENLESCMLSLFEFVNNNLNGSDEILRFLLPHIAHYYVIYVHPYFDCNGRMARMVSLWVSRLLGSENTPYFISEAINDTKKEYYKAISRSRDTRNDLTYFLIYVLDSSIKYALCYRKLNEYKETLHRVGEYFTVSEQAYIKKIMLCSNENYFTWKDFVRFINNSISKQGALKTLNNLEMLGILESKINSRKEKVFRLVQ